LPAFHGVSLGLSEKLLLRALAQVSGASSESLANDYRVLGDIGALAETYVQGAGQTRSVAEVYEAIHQIAQISGTGSVQRKIDQVCMLLTSHPAVEAKYILRFIAGKLRLGVGEATLLESLALARADRNSRPLLDRAYHITSDLGWVARLWYQAGEAGLRTVSVRVGYPIRPALCERATTSEEIIERLGLCTVEIKYDGLRCQIHKFENQVAIFSRNQERTTEMFPELVEAILRLFPNQEVILEGEALVCDAVTGEPLPFQTTSQRKRKHNVSQMAASYPLHFFAFDLLGYAGEDFTQRPYAERRAMLASLIQNDAAMRIAESIQTDDPQQVEAFFGAAVERGFEGVVAKRHTAPYTAGARNFNWIKMKRRHGLSDSIDVCIVGYDTGQGARTRLGIGTILGAVYDPDRDRFLTLSRIGSGFSESEWVQLKKLLDADIAPECPPHVYSRIVPEVWVHPKHVVTVTADEITRSALHTAGCHLESGDAEGYALRFPRAMGFVRTDKGAEQATTVSEILTLYQAQAAIGTDTR